MEKKKKSIEDVSMKDTMTKGAPVTHFFYEYEGERTIDPATLIEAGIWLWREQVYTNQVHDNYRLWQFAERLLDEHRNPRMYSRVEWLRYQIWMGKILPAGWRRSKPYPYKGLLISAVYFQEAQRLCNERQPERAWHIIALAYYYLGINSAPSVARNTAKAAAMKHAQQALNIRLLILTVLDVIKEKGLVDTIEKAKEEASRLIYESRHHEIIKSWLDEFDTAIPKETKERTRAKVKNNVYDRIKNLLDVWSLPSGPYPEIAQAFSQFNKKRGKKASGPPDLGVLDAMLVGGPGCFLRNINLLKGGEVLTSYVSQELDS